MKTKTASVVLTLTDLGSTEQVALAQGEAKKTKIGWGAGGGGWMSGAFAAGGASSDTNTEIGQVVTMAKRGRMYTGPDVKSKGRPRPGPRDDALPDR